MQECGQIFAIIMYLENLPVLKMAYILFLDTMSSQKQDGMHLKTIVLIVETCDANYLNLIISVENGLVGLMT